MSGPKISAAELEAMRRQEEERRRLIQEIYRLTGVLSRQGKTASQLQEMLLPIFSEDGMDRLVRDIDAIQREIQSVQQRNRGFVTRQNSRLQVTAATLSSLIQKNESLLKQAETAVEQARAKFVETKLAAFQKPQGNSRSTEAERAARQAVAEEATRLQSLLDALTIRAKRVKLSHAEVDNISNHIRSSLKDSERAPEILYQELHRIDLFELRPLRDRIEKREKEADELDSLLSAELAQYHTLCAEASITPQRFPFRKESIEAIRYECGRLISERHAQEADIPMMMQRVRQSLGDFGYEYIGEKCESLKVFREAYRVHGNVILHVIYDSTGRITMEVAVEDDCEREPSRQETDMLVEEQFSFCEAFEEIFRLINENGLALRKEQLFPCSPDFAQVINTAEFDKSAAAYASSYDIYRDYKQKYLEGDMT